MASDEQGKSDFNGILSSIDRKFDLIHAKWTDKKYFEVKFRTQIPRHSDDFNVLCDEWVDLFSNITNTVWVKKISNTGPKIRFRKQYQCWPQIGKEVHKEFLFDTRRCKATLDMKVLTDNPLTRRKNKHIRLGLNVVVKINFTHLHKVDTTLPFSCFIHTCEPQAEAPKPAIQPNDKLSQKVAEMVQKGLNASPKVVNLNTPVQSTKPSNVTKLVVNTNEIEPKTMHTINGNHFIQQHSMPLINMEPLTLNHIMPIQQNINEIKLEVQPQLQQLTQVVVSGPQIDLSEPLLMCQPTLMFDPSQIIPVTTHHISPHHFVQLHSHNITNQNAHYL